MKFNILDFLMKVAIIFVLYQTPNAEKNRLKEEIKNLGLDDFKIYFIDNSENNKGYADGVNEGIQQALIDNCELLIAANPDISLRNLKANDLLKGGEHFDIWGLTMKMHNRIYYGGKIDKVRLSGGLIKQKLEFNPDRVAEQEIFVHERMFITQ